MSLSVEFDRVWVALGGAKGIARITGAKRTTIAMWRRRGVFPADCYGVMVPEVARLGIAVVPELWGQRQPQQVA